MGLRNISRHSVATIVSELAYNLVLHTAGCGGIIHLIPLYQPPRKGVRVEAVDQGPGIADITLAMQDGYSTCGGLGGGLPGVRRLADEFTIDSQKGGETRIEAIKWDR